MQAKYLIGLLFVFLSLLIFGWAAGAGVDWKYRGAGGSSWVFGVEYLHYGFPTHNVTVISNSGPNTSVTFGVRQDVDVVKGRISYFWPLSP